jgi:hypothetical protein
MERAPAKDGPERARALERQGAREETQAAQEENLEPLPKGPER